MAESAEIDRLQQEILLVRESNEGALQENSALKSRVQELEKQIQDIQRLLTLRSDELAQVQAAQSAASEQMEEMQPLAEPETPVAETETAEEPVPADRMAPAEPSVAEEGEPVAMEGEEPVVPVPEGTVIDEVDIESKIDTAQSEMATEQPAAADETPPAAVAEKPETKPAEAKPESPAAELPEKKVGYFDGLKENSTMLAIVGGAGVVLIGLLLLIMRRRKEAEAEFAESILVSPDSDIMPTGAEDSSSLTSPTDETSFMSDFSPSDIDALQDETGEVDPLSEADVYIAYGRYQQAEELINQAIEKYPDREELKHKLLEIYFSAKKNLMSIQHLRNSCMTMDCPSGSLMPGARSWQWVKSSIPDMRCLPVRQEWPLRICQVILMIWIWILLLLPKVRSRQQHLKRPGTLLQMHRMSWNPWT
jgi:pilus assembly protein FimV